MGESSILDGISHTYTVDIFMFVTDKHGFTYEFAISIHPGIALGAEVH